MMRQSLLLSSALVLGVGAGAYALWRGQAKEPGDESTRAQLPGGYESLAGGPSLNGHRAPAAPADGPTTSGNGPARDELVASLTAELERAGTGTINPKAAQEAVARIPGGAEALIRFGLASHPAAEELLPFARQLVTHYLATAELEAEHRASIAQLIFTKLEEADGAASPDAVVVAMEWLWRSGGQRLAISSSEWSGVLLEAADQLLEAGDLRVSRALARLNVAPGTVASTLLTVLRRSSCEDLDRIAYLLRDADLLRVLRTSGDSIEEALVQRVESCGTPAPVLAGLVMRVALRHPWSAMQARLESLAADGSLPGVDFIACVREAVVVQQASRVPTPSRPPAVGEHHVNQEPLRRRDYFVPASPDLSDSRLEGTPVVRHRPFLGGFPGGRGLRGYHVHTEQGGWRRAYRERRETAPSAPRPLARRLVRRVPRVRRGCPGPCG